MALHEQFCQLRIWLLFRLACPGCTKRDRQDGLGLAYRTLTGFRPGEVTDNNGGDFSRSRQLGAQPRFVPVPLRESKLAAVTTSDVCCALILAIRDVSY